jgi:hypothetical protein
MHGINLISTRIIIMLNFTHPAFQSLKGSVFGPNVMYSLSCASSKGRMILLPSFAQSSHLIGPILGGILGGKIMLHAFPDDI